MWILALLFWKRPRLAQNVVIGWLMLMGAELSIVAPGQVYLRCVAPTSPYIYPLPSWALLAGLALGPIAVTGAIWFLLARLRRDRRARATN